MLLGVLAAMSASERTVFAQDPVPTTGLEAGGGMIWGSMGFQSDLGGTVNSSGTGFVSQRRAEINANSWAERYDAALAFRIGAAYNLNETSQLFGALTWDQGEADEALTGLLGGEELLIKLDDYQGWGIDFGYRYFYPTTVAVKPFVSGSLGFQRVQEITADLSAPDFRAEDVPFYDDSWVPQWRVGTGFLWDLSTVIGVLVTVDVKYSGLLSDAAGLGTLGFDRVNDTGNRWSLPYMGGVYVKF
jgi:hypothetical protein